MTVPDIVKQIFGDLGFSDYEDTLSGNYRTWDYLVQYRESAFNFVSRILEQEGIYYYFRHEDGKHTLVLADGYGSHEAWPGYETVPYFPVGAQAREDDHIDAWRVTKQMVSDAYAANDFNFESPKANLLQTRSSPTGNDGETFKLYDYPGGFSNRDDGGQQVRVRLEEKQGNAEVAEGDSNVRGLASGFLFTLDGHPRDEQNREYLIVSTHYDFQVNAYESASWGPSRYRCLFEGTHSDVQYRAPRTTRKPSVEGPQTATVVGPSGEEIWTDKYGRVKLQFHWDRYGESDEKSSCWVRVAQVWAGTNWGAMHIPRIGQEVIVDFLEGDPDRPIITGRVYNGSNMPPYGLPGNQTQSDIKSRSTKDGAAPNANEIRFEDRKGTEEFFIQAEKDLNSLVKNSETANVMGDRTRSVGGKDTLSVGKTRTTTVKGDDSYFVTDGDVLEGFGKSHSNNVKEFATYTIGKEYSLDVGEKSAQANFAKSGDIEIANKKAKIALDGGGSIQVSSDDGTITISRGSTQIEIASDKITITASAKVQIKAGSGIEASVGGSKLELTSTGATVTATMIKLNS
jgi:type VI secretion system secreted protein VgrG